MSNVSVVKNRCTGCGACKNVCPISCIEMVPNQEGFLFPKISKNCVNCSKCVSTCPVVNFKKDNPNRIQNGYAGFIDSMEDRKKSTSGGVGYAIGKYFLELNGVIYGCILDDNLKAMHIRVDTMDKLNATQSSKYVQSSVDSQFKIVQNDLESNKYVAFFGTPCQIAGLKAFLAKDYDKLLLIDIVCHGVPSPLLFQSYISYMEKKYKSKITQYNFRSKNGGGRWESYKSEITFSENNKSFTIIKDYSTDPFGYSFIHGDCLRESCYSCSYCSIERISDITIGDFWGYELNEKLKDIGRKGISSVVTNSNKGEIFLNKITGIKLIPIDVSQITLKQENLKHPTLRPSSRDSFYLGIDNPTKFWKKHKPRNQFRWFVKKMIKLILNK